MKPAEAEVLREYAEKLAGERFPEADKIVANPHHQDGPIVEVKQGKQTSVAASRLIEAMKDAPEKGAASLLEAMENAAGDGDADAKAGVACLRSGAPADLTDFEEAPRPEPTGDVGEEPIF